jgi:hypothetical protein
MLVYIFVYIGRFVLGAVGTLNMLQRNMPLAVNLLYPSKELSHYNEVWRRYAQIYSLYVCKFVFSLLIN